MIITPFEVYLITRLDALIIATNILLSISVILAILTGIGALALTTEKLWDDDDFSGLANTVRRLLSISVVSGLIHVFTPSTKEMCAILVIPKIVNSDIVTDDLPDATKELVTLAREWVQELKPTKKEDVQ